MPALPQWWYPTMPNAQPVFTPPAASGVNSLPSGYASGYDPAYGGVPSVPSPTGSAADVLGGNVANLPQLGALGSGLTGISAADAAQALGSNLPGYQNMINQSSANTQALLRGQIPADVVAQISRMGAERGVSMGSPNSPAAMASTLGALLGTSLGLQRQGEANLTGAIARTPTGPQFNPASMLVSPQDQQMWAYLARVLGAAPIPASAAAANLAALRGGLNRGAGAVGPTTSPLALTTPAVQPPTVPQGFPYNPPSLTQGWQLPYEVPTPYPMSPGPETPLPSNMVDLGDGTVYNLDTGQVTQSPNWQAGEQLPTQETPFPFPDLIGAGLGAGGGEDWSMYE